MSKYQELIKPDNPESAVVLGSRLYVDKSEDDIKFENSLSRMGQVLEHWCSSIKDRVEYFDQDTEMRQMLRACSNLNELIRSYREHVVRQVIEASRTKQPKPDWLGKWVDMFNRFKMAYNEWARDANRFSEQLEEVSGARPLRVEFITEELAPPARFG
jgi:hypothetical protein